MRADYIIIGILVILLLGGLVFALLYQNRAAVLGYSAVPGQTAYTASIYQIAPGYFAASPSATSTPQVVYSAPVVYPLYTTAAYPPAAYNAATWYTSPSAYAAPGVYSYSYRYYNPGAYSETVIPGSYYQVSPGYQQTYQYYNPGYSGGYY